ncbi:D-beta-hydroxybutyrate dehydrogenase, mitochondrial [Protopterus annectens]|uniref:D-beta-hydroxybutyrate dehydrogenase, mitochondrial n=1 Tax=Protopterus annectens TaxID=7888 RepID=UPI001CFAC833|nr:D-beta-hydroxybutyrate dehydrogenase, mitochondrial [Protopterus annectens]
MATVSYKQMALLVLLSLILTLGLGFGIPGGLNYFAAVLGFSDSSVTYGIVFVYLLVVFCVLLPPIPRGSVKVEGKAVLITGCDTGFGFALAKHLHALGFTVFAGCLFKNKNGDGAKELESIESDRMKVLQMDVRNEEEVAQAVEYVKRNLQDPEKSLWGIVNNAGIATFGEIEFTAMEKYKEAADVNLWGTVRVTKAFLPLIRRAKGRVVNMSSQAGRMCLINRSTYCITKFGVEAFSDCLRYEMHRWGVKVCIIEPGNFIAATGIFTREKVQVQADEMWNSAPDTVREDYGKAHFNRQVNMMNSFCNSGSKEMSPVINAITDALTSKYPYTRYNPVEAYWWIKMQVMTHLPAAIADRIYVY